MYAYIYIYIYIFTYMYIQISKCVAYCSHGKQGTHDQHSGSSFENGKGLITSTKCSYMCVCVYTYIYICICMHVVLHKDISDVLLEHI